jgi:hypothetical protein
VASEEFEQGESQERTYTRAKVLKRAGLGAAAISSVPLFISTEGAFAANISSTVCVKLALNGSGAGGVGPCDYGESPARPCPCHGGGFVGPVCDAHGQGRCFCFLDVKGCAQCRDTYNIGSACSSNADCPTGWKCVYTCLDGCPNGLGCCDTCTGNSQPSSGPSGAGLVCLPPCSSIATGSLTAAALKAVKAGA